MKTSSFHELTAEELGHVVGGYVSQVSPAPEYPNGKPLASARWHVKRSDDTKESKRNRAWLSRWARWILG